MSEHCLTPSLSLSEVYQLRNWASKTQNQILLWSIKSHLNGKVGAFVDHSSKESVEGSIPPLRLQAVSLREVLSLTPPEVMIVVDHAITNTQEAERNSHVLQEVVYEHYGHDIKVTMHSGEVDGSRLATRHVVLLALPTCFAVLKARGTLTLGRGIPYSTLREW